MCLQKTFLKNTNQLNIKSYQQYIYINKAVNRASEGFSALIRKDIPQHQINIVNDFEVIVVKTTLHKPAKFYSIYIRPHDPINEIKLNKLIEQIR